MRGQSLAERSSRLVPGAHAEMLAAFLEVADDLHEIRKALVRVVIEYLVDPYRFGLADDDHLVDVAGAIGAFKLPEGVFADQQLGGVLFARTFEACGEVNTVADQGVVHARRRADIARHDAVRIEPDADLDRKLAFGL